MLQDNEKVIRGIQTSLGDSDSDLQQEILINAKYWENYNVSDLKTIGGKSIFKTTEDDENNIEIHTNHIIDVTYSELKSLRDNSELQTGTQYRITNYVTTTVQEDTKSANHSFEIIVTATSTNMLSEVAIACWNKKVNRRIEINEETTPSEWVNVEVNDIPEELKNKLSFTPDKNTDIKCFTTLVELNEGELDVEFKFKPGSGSKRINCVGVDIVKINDDNEEVVSYDYHVGYTGNNHDKNSYELTVTECGEYKIRYFVDHKSEGINATSYITSVNVSVLDYDYFDNRDLNAWEIKYCLDNDTNRFAWADNINGKGVIYYMKDEFGNEAPYDFKNIMFKRDSTWVGNHKGTDKFSSLNAFDNIDTWFYTFSRINGTTITDDSLNIGLSSNKPYIYPCRNNTILPYSKEYNGIIRYYLNNNIFIGNGAESNHFGENSINNTFTGIYNNYFEMGCQNNTVYKGFSTNHIGINFKNNLITKSFNYNNVDSNFYGNQLGSFLYCKFGNNFRENNSLGKTIKYCDFGNDIQVCSDLPSMTNVIFDNSVIKYLDDSNKPIYNKGLKDITLRSGETADNVLSKFENNTSKVLFTKQNNVHYVIDIVKYIIEYNDKIELLHDLGVFSSNKDGEDAASNISVIRNPEVLFLKFYNSSSQKNVYIQQMVVNHKCAFGQYGYAKQYIYLDGKTYFRKCWFTNLGGNYSFVDDLNHSNEWILVEDEDGLLYSGGVRTLTENDIEKIVTLEGNQTISGSKRFNNDININGKTIIKSSINNGELKVFDANDDTAGFTICTKDKFEGTNIPKLELLATNNVEYYKYQFPKLENPNDTDTVVVESKLEDYITNSGLNGVVEDIIEEVRENEKVTAAALNDLNSKVNNLEFDVSLSILVTYSELYKLRDKSELVPGTQYRIKDYVTTTTQENTKSAGDAFDIIVTADSISTFNEIVKVCQNDSNDHFVNVNLSAWKVWYCFDNDTNRFAWADEENGKGVIYRMIDEWGNDCPYDFKNIKFTINNKDYYTFSQYSNGSISDYSIVGNSEKNVNVYGNIIGAFNSEGKMKLNNIVFINNAGYFESDGYECHSNIFNTGCHSNTFNTGCHSNTFGYNCHSNTFNGGCYSNTFGDECNMNTISSNCHSNTFGNKCNENKIGTECNSNIFGDYCEKNILGDYNEIIKFGSGCSKNIIIDTQPNKNVNGDNIDIIDKYNPSYSSTYVDNKKASYKSYVRYITFGDGVQNNIFWSTGVVGKNEYVQMYEVDSNLVGKIVELKSPVQASYLTRINIDSFGFIQHYTEKDFSVKNVSYKELLDLRTNSQLTPSRKYRITDYTTTTLQEGTQSGNNLFDIIVEALTEDTLSEDVKIINHEFEVKKLGVSIDWESDFYYMDRGWKEWSYDNMPDELKALVSQTTSVKRQLFTKDLKAGELRIKVASRCHRNTRKDNSNIYRVPCLGFDICDSNIDEDNQASWNDHIISSDYHRYTASIQGNVIENDSRPEHYEVEYVLNVPSDGRYTICFAVDDTDDILTNSNNPLRSELGIYGEIFGFENEKYYFDNSDLNSWEVKYCFDNDTNRFAWVDTENGKGVIYYMKDEFGNEAHYDFKNIKFNCSIFENGNYPFEYTYTFSDVNGNDLSLSAAAHENIIKPYVSSGKQILNHTIFIGNNIHSNTLDENNYKNIIWNDGCYYNNIGNEFQENNIISQNSFHNNTIGNLFKNNIMQSAFSSNYVGHNSIYNEFNYPISYCKFGSYIQHCVFDNSEDYQSSVSEMKWCTFGDGLDYAQYIPCCQKVTFEDRCLYNNESANWHINDVVLKDGSKLVEALIQEHDDRLYVCRVDGECDIFKYKDLHTLEEKIIKPIYSNPELDFEASNNNAEYFGYVGDLYNLNVFGDNILIDSISVYVREGKDSPNLDTPVWCRLMKYVNDNWEIIYQSEKSKSIRGIAPETLFTFKMVSKSDNPLLKTSDKIAITYVSSEKSDVSSSVKLGFKSIFKNGGLANEMSNDIAVATHSPAFVFGYTSMASETSELFIGTFNNINSVSSKAAEIDICSNSNITKISFKIESGSRKNANGYIEQFIKGGPYTIDGVPHYYIDQTLYFNGETSYRQIVYTINDNVKTIFSTGDWRKIIDYNNEDTISPTLYSKNYEVVNIGSDQTISGSKRFNNDININGKTIIKSSIDNGELKVFNANDDTAGFTIRTKDKFEETNIPKLELLATDNNQYYKYQFPKLENSNDTDTVVVKSQFDQSIEDVNQSIEDAITTFNQSIEDVTTTFNQSIEDFITAPLINVTYSELVELKKSSSLISGMKYRITDYVTTSSQQMTHSAEHQFDIIVEALSNNTLSENASAIKSETVSVFDFGEGNYTTLFNWKDVSNWEEVDVESTDTPQEILNITQEKIISKQQGTRGCKGGDVVYVSIMGYTTSIDSGDKDVIGLGAALYNSQYELITFDYGYDKEGYCLYIPEDFSDNDVNVIVRFFIHSREKEAIDGYCGAAAYKGRMIEVADNYFAGSNLDAWEIKYCLDNDVNRFAWADNIKGKGVIYYMKDEFGNEAPYDFKNIKCGNFYTFDYGKEIEIEINNQIRNVIEHYDGSTIYGEYCYGNKIDCYKNSDDGKYYIPKNIMKNTNSDSKCYCNIFKNNAISNIFGDGCYNNIIGVGSCNNIFEDNCYSNTFGDNCNGNIIGTDCNSNIFGKCCASNVLGSESNFNNFGNKCVSNIFGDRFVSNTIGNECENNTFIKNDENADNVKYVCILNGVKNANINVDSSLYDILNITILQGDYSTKNIELNKNNVCIAMNSKGNVTIFTIADIICKVNDMDEPSEGDSEYIDDSSDSDSEIVEEPSDSDSEYIDDSSDSDSEYIDDSSDSDSEYIDDSSDSDSEYIDDSSDSDSEYIDDSSDSDSEITDEPSEGDSEITDEPSEGDSEITDEPSEGDSEIVEEPSEGDPEINQEV